jgi:small subunit ribosomal protein S1
VSEQDEDFSAMFEASVKPRRFDRGQTIEGTIVAFGLEVAFVNVGGKGEAQIDFAELKDAEGDVEVSVGDRIQATVVSTSGIVLSRKGVRNAATQRELEDAYQAGLCDPSVKQQTLPQALEWLWKDYQAGAVKN